RSWPAIRTTSTTTTGEAGGPAAGSRAATPGPSPVGTRRSDSSSQGLARPRRRLRRLGLDLSRDRPRRPDDPAVLHGWDAVPDRGRAAVRVGDEAARSLRPADRAPLALGVPDRAADARRRQLRRRLGGADARHRDGVADHRLRAALDGPPRPGLLRPAA